MNASSSSLSSLLLLLGVLGVTSGQYYGGGQGLGILPGTSGYGNYGGSPYASGGGLSNVHFPGPYGAGLGGAGSRHGQGYLGNGGIGIKQTDANLADLYGLPRQLAQAPAPRPPTAPQPGAPLEAYLGGAVGGPQYGFGQQAYGPQLGYGRPSYGPQGYSPLTGPYGPQDPYGIGGPHGANRYGGQGYLGL